MINSMIMIMIMKLKNGIKIKTPVGNIMTKNKI